MKALVSNDIGPVKQILQCAERTGFVLIVRHDVLTPMELWAIYLELPCYGNIVWAGSKK